MTNATHNIGGHKAYISQQIMSLVAIEPKIATKCVVLRKQVVLQGSNPCSAANINSCAATIGSGWADEDVPLARFLCASFFVLIC